MKATHEITAVTYLNGEADLSWTDLETGERFTVTIALTREQCLQLSKVVPPCVYSHAIIKPPNSNHNQRMTKGYQPHGSVDHLPKKVPFLISGVSES